MAIQLVVFDIAGTTLKDENNVTDILQQTLFGFHYHLSKEVIDPLMGYEKGHAIRLLLEYESGGMHVSQERVEDIRQAFVARMVRFYETRDLVALPNVEKTFERLKEKGIKIGINTGFSQDIAEVVVRKLGWEKNKLIDIVVASDQVQQGRPHPDMIRLIMQSTGVTNAADVAKVGDTEADIHEGQNAGCRFVIGVTTGTFHRSQLEIYSPTHIVDDIAEIIPIVSN